jgi:hypothetical protein
MKKKFNASLIQFPDKLVTEEHSSVAMDQVKAGWEDEHRSELDRHVQIEPIKRPDFPC